MHCILTCRAGKCSTGVLSQAGSATIRPEKGPRHSAARLRHGLPTRKGEERAREGLAAGRLCCDTNGRIVIGGQLGRWVVSRDRLRYGQGHGHDSVGCARDIAGEATTWCAAEHAGGAATRHSSRHV